jgi:hypothetical protein
MTWWEHLDFTSVEAKLYLNGKDRYVNKFGALMSVLAGIAISVLSIYFMIIFIDKSEISVLYFEQTKYFSLYANMTDKPFFWRVADFDKKTTDPRLITLWPIYLNYINNTLASSTILETQPCSQQRWTKFPQYQDIPFSYDLKEFECIKENKYNLNVTMDTLTWDYNYFNIYLAPCKNSTANNNFCLPQKQIDDYLDKANLKLEWSFPSYSIDHLNKTLPIIDGNEFTAIKLYPSMYYKYLTQVKIVNYTDDKGTVMEELETFNFFGPDPLRSKIEVGMKGTKVNIADTFALLQIRPNTNVFDNFKRNYPKLQSIVANIGGVIKFIMIIAQVLSKYISSQMLQVDLSNNFHYPSDEADNKLKKKKSHHIQLPSISSPEKTLTSNEEILGTYHKKSKKTSSPNISPIKKNLQSSSLGRTLNKSGLPSKILYKKNLSFKEALFLPFCVDKKSFKHSIKEYDRIIRAKLSSDYLIKIFSDFDNFKKIFLNENQMVLFENIKYSSLSDQLNELRKTQNSNYFNKVETIISQLSSSDNQIDKVLISMV